MTRGTRSRGGRSPQPCPPSPSSAPGSPWPRPVATRPRHRRRLLARWSPCPTPPSTASRRRYCRRCPSSRRRPRPTPTPRVRAGRPAVLDERRRHPGGRPRRHTGAVADDRRRRRRAVPDRLGPDRRHRQGRVQPRPLRRQRPRPRRHREAGHLRHPPQRQQRHGRHPRLRRRHARPRRDVGPRGGADAVHPRHLARRSGSTPTATAPRTRRTSHDAATATAVYLCSGPGDLSTDSEGARSAVLRYNHSDAYADQVLALAEGYRGGYTVVPASDLTDAQRTGSPYLPSGDAGTMREYDPVKASQPAASKPGHRLPRAGPGVRRAAARAGPAPVGHGLRHRHPGSRAQPRGRHRHRCRGRGRGWRRRWPHRRARRSPDPHAEPRRRPSTTTPALPLQVLPVGGKCPTATTPCSARWASRPLRPAPDRWPTVRASAGPRRQRTSEATTAAAMTMASTAT